MFASGVLGESWPMGNRSVDFIGVCLSVQKLGSSMQCEEGTEWLLELLMEVQLQQYFLRIRDELNVTRLSHFDYVKNEDLEKIGMGRPGESNQGVLLVALSQIILSTRHFTQRSGIDTYAEMQTNFFMILSVMIDPVITISMDRLFFFFFLLGLSIVHESCKRRL